jgi:hypothetical protein
MQENILLFTIVSITLGLLLFPSQRIGFKALMTYYLGVNLVLTLFLSSRLYFVSLGIVWVLVGVLFALFILPKYLIDCSSLLALLIMALSSVLNLTELSLISANLAFSLLVLAIVKEFVYENLIKDN